MDSNISFDPNKLSNKEKIFLKAKLDLTYDEDDPDGCKVFKLKARNNVYPQWKIWETIWRRFGKKTADLTHLQLLIALNMVLCYIKNRIWVFRICAAMFFV